MFNYLLLFTNLTLPLYPTFTANIDRRVSEIKIDKLN